MASKTILEFEKPIFALEEKVEELRLTIYNNLTRWQRVQIARHPERPYTLDYIENIFEDFNELHGDRTFRDDPAMVGGMATLNGMPVMVVGQQKGRNTKTKVIRNFGMANPDGYRKANRLFRLAEKFNRPIITFLDTPGAACGLEAEERGQAEAIASNLVLMSSLKVPIICVVIGEGASGGAIGIGVGDRILMLENSWYSVISPESCSSILWRSWDFKEQAAEALKLTAEDLKEHGIIDEIIPEPVGGAHRKRDEMFEILKKILLKELKKLSGKSTSALVKKRRQKYYDIGVWDEEK